MLKVGLIGYGAIAQYAAAALPENDGQLSLVLVRSGRADAARQTFGRDVEISETLGANRPDLMIDCAGHAGLRQHGAQILRAGVPLVTVSIGALADAELHDQLAEAARAGGTALHLCTGAVGGLDALSSASFGQLEKVSYTGRKPPRGWKGSRAEEVLDLDRPGPDPATHFAGSARDAALLYPKNANVAAAVALAGIGFDNTQVELISDPGVDANIHEIRASGDFGEMLFSISGNTLPGNPRTSALAAMNVVKKIADQSAAIRL